MVEDAGVEQFFLSSVFLLVGGEDEGTDAMRVEVDEGESLLHLGSAFQDVRFHYVALFCLLSLLLSALGFVQLQCSAFLLHLCLLLLGFIPHFIFGLSRLLPLFLFLPIIVHGCEVVIQSVHQFIEQIFFHVCDLGEEGRILIFDVAFGLLVPAWEGCYF